MQFIKNKIGSEPTTCWRVFSSKNIYHQKLVLNQQQVAFSQKTFGVKRHTGIKIGQQTSWKMFTNKNGSYQLVKKKEGLCIPHLREYVNINEYFSKNVGIAWNLAVISSVACALSYSSIVGWKISHV